MGSTKPGGGTKKPRPTRGGGGGGDANAWMSTFSDLLMLMLTFFVLLLTMSSMDSQKLSEIARPGIHLDGEGTAKSSPKSEVMPSARVAAPEIEAIHRYEEPPPGRRMRAQRDALETLFIAHKFEGRGWFERRPAGLGVHIESGALFEPGEASWVEGAEAALDDLAALLDGSDRSVRVEAWQRPASDDDLGARDEAFLLGLKRASRLAETLAARGVDRERLRLAAYPSEAGERQGRLLRQAELVSIVTGEDAAR